MEYVMDMGDNMIESKAIKGILDKYDYDKIKISMVASHSTLDLFDGAEELGFNTLGVCQKGREKTYLRYKRIVKETILLDKFRDMIDEEIQSKLRDNNVIFVPNRSFTVYVPMEDIENKLFIPIFGNRSMLITDERDRQYELFEKSGIKFPRRFEHYEDIDTLVVVKIQESERKHERAFFLCSSPKEFETKSEERLKNGLIGKEDLNNVWIEEYVVGALFNFNFFYSPIQKELEFLGIDRRIQTNLDGILKMTAEDQLDSKIVSRNIEVGHESVTIRESLLEKVFEMGEKFYEAAKILYPPGIIGPFALQGAVTPDLDIITFDLSPRMPGSPVLFNSPYSKYYYGCTMTAGKRVSREIKDAIEEDRLIEIVS